eukprot:TRINITY_DN84503_c0_g1_i1.p1 TRINITY_DN84503_c0_g1~~TRINITY_DN84503_c0_g1_i1.p1  ORF type:complete len:139 (-),score=28.87 TRINITY_DN84503_c0_g1_i1:41-457(-)
MPSVLNHQPEVAQERLVNILHSLGKSRIPELEVGDFYDDLERTGAERESDKLETWEEQLGVRLGLRIIDQKSDWKEHQNICPSLKQVYDLLHGDGLAQKIQAYYEAIYKKPLVDFVSFRRYCLDKLIKEYYKIKFELD